MNYLIVQEWENTKGNHAGMKHMCDMLKELWPNEYTVLVKSVPKTFPRGKNKLINKINYYRRIIYTRYIYPFEYRRLCSPIIKHLQDTDKVFLLEYLTTDYPQKELAQFIKKMKPEIRIYALSHLTPLYYMGYPDPVTMIRQWSLYVDKMLTLGSSLSLYFIQCGIPREKISTGFHYVDTNYYTPQGELLVGKRIKIISMGALQRDFSILAKIVKQTPHVEYNICKGYKDVDSLFKGLQNVTLKGYIPENELRELMEEADLSLNILEDTVGSNVITTSMAVGLGIIVSDVGSIRDYCDVNNAVFCSNTVDSFVSAIKMLSYDKCRIEQMKEASVKKAKKFQIEKVHEWFSNIQ